MPSPALEVVNVRKSFGAVKAVDGISFSVERAGTPADLHDRMVVPIDGNTRLPFSRSQEIP